MNRSAEEILSVADIVARRYKARCWWAEVDDLRSQAAVVVLEAARTWDPEVGVPFAAYAQRAAFKALGRYLWAIGSPVSEKRYRSHELRGTRRAALTTIDPTNPLDGEAAFLPESEAPGADQAIDEERFRQRVRDRIAEMAAATKNGHLAAAVMLDGIPATEVDADLRTVHRATEAVRRKLRDDPEAWALWLGEEA